MMTGTVPMTGNRGLRRLPGLDREADLRGHRLTFMNHE